VAVCKVLKIRAITYQHSFDWECSDRYCTSVQLHQDGGDNAKYMSNAYDTSSQVSLQGFRVRVSASMDEDF
jgi:hypothetical protein